MNRTKACLFLDCWSDCLRLIAFASIVEVNSIVGVKSQDCKHICIAYTSDDSSYITHCTPLSIDGATEFY